MGMVSAAKRRSSAYGINGIGMAYVASEKWQRHFLLCLAANHCRSARVHRDVNKQKQQNIKGSMWNVGVAADRDLVE